MSFRSELLAALGDTADISDIRVTLRKCYFYDFVDDPLRVWDGQGKLFAGGQEWIGTMNEAGQNIHQTPALRDPRDNASPRYEFGLPYVDEATWLRLKADQAKAKDRDLTIYHVLIKHGEGLRPGVELSFAAKLVIKAATFSTGYDGLAGSEVLNRRVTAVCRSIEEGRSKSVNGSLTDTAQRARASLLGLSSDSGCSFVASNARRTYVDT